PDQELQPQRLDLQHAPQVRHLTQAEHTQGLLQPGGRVAAPDLGLPRELRLRDLLLRLEQWLGLPGAQETWGALTLEQLAPALVAADSGCPLCLARQAGMHSDQ